MDIRAGFDEAWFVERLVTFEQMVDRRRPVGSRSLPVYAAGFMCSASHLPEAASNRRQIDPLETGCDYADGVPPPLMRRVGRFVDQQAFGSGA